MRPLLIIISIFFIFTCAFGQKTNKKESADWSDTTFIIVKLNDTIRDTKVVAVEIGKKATIYVKLRPLTLEAHENLSNDFIKEDYNRIIHYFDSASLKGDTILVGEYLYLRGFEYLVSHQLVEGFATVYYKKRKSFVDTISHRLERYGSNAFRFFYLPDNRPFFAVHEISGILDKHNDTFSKEHNDAYVKLGEKLQSVRKE